MRRDGRRGAQSHTAASSLSSDGTAIATYVDIESTSWILTGRAVSSSRQRSVRLGWAQVGPVRYGVFSAMPATFAFTGDLTVEVGKALAALRPR